MTWDDFERRGFLIMRSPKLFPGEAPILVAPDDATSRELFDLRFEIDSRLDLVGDGIDFATWRDGRAAECGHCGDPTPTFRTCGLCELARAKALRLKKERAA